MGNCFGTPRNGPDANSHQLSANYGSSQPPAYSIDHNQSCRVLKWWEDNGSESRNFKYVIYVVNNSLFNKHQKTAQQGLLEFIHEVAKIQELDVWVKCLDYSQTTEDPATAEEMQLYKDMLASDAQGALKLWEGRKKKNPRAGNLGGNRQQTSEDIVDELIVAALSKFAQEWKLEYILQNRETIIAAPPTIMATGVSKLRAAFEAQARIIALSWSSAGGGLPTVGITLAPDSIPDMTMTSIQNSLERVYKNWTRRKMFENTGRMDGYTMQIISIGSTSGAQWKIIDDLKKGQEDISDHTHLDTERFLRLGPGVDLARKVLLGSTNADIDRDYRGKSNMILYGKDCDVGYTRFSEYEFPCTEQDQSNRTNMNNSIDAPSWPLSKADIRERLEPENRYDLLFSDETHFDFANKAAARIARKEATRYKPKHQQERHEPEGRDKKRLHCWVIGPDYKSSLVGYEGSNNNNGKISQQVYIKDILELYMKKWLDEGKTFVLEEENDSSHGPGQRSKITRAEDPSASPKLALQMAVKAINNTAAPSGIVATLLVFGAYHPHD
ncbi:kinesin related protein 1 [Colletotrichum incanum]|uniref:Kinesin related protein 1 n=1 Tax=Colletotrichum incanum TaxID=1573173 RepID=A0A167DFK7_COLIC|nr:kinesin related protein 1 [Colletotrichum incanum]